VLSLDLEQERQAVRAFFTQEVVLRKWSPLHWLFIRRSIERVLHDDHEGDRSIELLELLDLFNVITQKGSGLAAMDFGYAFDSLIWDSNLDSKAHTQIALIIAEAIKHDFVPQRYLTDAEILVPAPGVDGYDLCTSEAILSQKQILSYLEAFHMRSLVPQETEKGIQAALGAADAAHPPWQIGRRYSRMQSL